MAYEQKDNSGSFFKNRKKEKDTHPDMTGTVMLGGVEYWVSAWRKIDKNGDPWYSMSFKEKEARPAASPGHGGGFQKKAPPANDGPDDGLPW